MFLFNVPYKGLSKMLEKKMKPLIHQTRNEEGSVLIVSLLMLVLLTIIGISASTTSEIEIQIAGNDKLHKTVFHSTDSGIYSTPAIISASLELGANDPSLNVNYVKYNITTPANYFYRQIMAYDGYDASNRRSNNSR